MAIKQEPFVPYKTEEEREKQPLTFTVKITEGDLQWFTYDLKKHCSQPKNSSMLKQLARIGAAKVLYGDSDKVMIDTLRENFRRAHRLGISDKEYKVK